MTKLSQLILQLQQKAMSTQGHSYAHGSSRRYKNWRLIRVRRRFIEQCANRYYYGLFFWAMHTYAGVLQPQEIERCLVELFYYVGINGTTVSSIVELSVLLRWIIEQRFLHRN